MTKLNSKYLKSSPDNKVVYLSGASFNSIAKSRSEIQKLKNLINKNNKVIIFKNVVEKNIIKTIEKNRNRILKSKPFFFKTYLGSDDLYIFNKENKKSHVKGYFKKIELYPWNKKNKKTYNSLKKIINLKCKMDSLSFNLQKKMSFFDKKKFIKLQLNHYPFKKGFLNKHIDGIHKKILVLHIGMNNKLHKNIKGGLIFHFNDKKINIDKYLGLGDVAIFNPIVPHEVTPPDTRDGRWSLLVSSGYFGKTKGTKLQSKQLN
tara:strand:- start:59 stop:841 length:783 start_codon:yes stop_codon:yes gene_type:complete